MTGQTLRWLRAEGSLTMHLRRARAPLTVQVLGQAREPARAEDARPLGLLALLSVGAAVAFAKSRPAETPTDELIVVSMCVG
ncbi:hypothetical protein F7Q92_16105, partial [Ideonella dechloratans]